MRYTLLEMTQRILDSMESDEVSSINETPESKSVANIIKECYFDIVGKLGMEESEGIFKLSASTDSTKPTLMLVPEGVSRIESIKYRDLHDPDVRWGTVSYVSNEEFLFYQEASTLDDENTERMEIILNGRPWEFYIKNDRPPSYYTIFDEINVVFDSYQRAYEDTLSEINSMGIGSLVPVWKMVDSFIPDLDARQFQLLLQDAKSTAHIELKQAPNQKAEAKYRSNFILTQKKKNDNDPLYTIQPHYRFGRNGLGMQRSQMVRAMRKGR